MPSLIGSGIIPKGGITSLSTFLIDSAAGGDIAVVAAVASKTVRIWRLFFVVGASATNIQFWDGPSASGTKLSGVMILPAYESFVLDWSFEPWFVTTAGNGFIINSSVAVQLGGTAYGQQS